VGEFSETLRAARLRSGLSQRQVAQAVAVSRVSPSRWERRRVLPLPENVLALADLYGLDPAELLRLYAAESEERTAAEARGRATGGQEAAAAGALADTLVEAASQTAGSPPRPPRPGGGRGGLQARHEISALLAEARSPAECMPEVLAVLCRNLGWSLGLVWQTAPSGERLRLFASWAARPEAVASFLAASARLEFAAGDGLPGRVWAARRPVWLRDAGTARRFPRRDEARQAGLHGAVAFPLLHAGNCLGIAELFAERVRERDGNLIALLAAVGGELARFLSLAEAESRFRAVAQSTGDAVIVADGAGRVVSWNAGAERMFGHGVGEVLGQPLSHLMPERHKAAHERALAAASASVEAGIAPRVLPLAGRRRGGEEFPIELTLSGWRTGNEIFYGGIIRDVTERTQAQHALARSEAAFRLLAENATEMVASSAPDGTIHYVSPSCRTLVGFAPEELVGRNAFEFLHPDEVAAIRERLRALFEQDTVTLEYRGRHKEGDYVWLELSARAVRDEAGALVEIRTASRAIGPRKRVEVELRAQRDYAEGLVNAMQDGLVVLSPAAVVVEVSPSFCALTGYSHDELVGRGPPYPYWPDATRERLDRALARLREEGAADWELEFRRRDGERVPVILSAFVMRGPDGDVLGYPATVKDVTEQRAVQQARDEFIVLASHELRTPLTSVLGYLEAVLAEEVGALTAQQRHFLEVAERNASKLLRLVGDLMVVVRGDAKRLALEVAEVDLAALARECAEGARPAAEERGMGLEMRADPVPLLKVDRARIAQVIDNLVSNALKFTQPGGRVEVRTALRGEEVALEVADTGPGLSPQEQVHLFERFYRTSAATRDQIPGTGLGLAISKMIVEAHGGRIVVESEKGKGTTFQVLLPVAR
jgi:PAS domain S-box-containing protein